VVVLLGLAASHFNTMMPPKNGVHLTAASGAPLILGANPVE
jgi:hypothetical protein